MSVERSSLSDVFPSGVFSELHHNWDPFWTLSNTRRIGKLIRPTSMFQLIVLSIPPSDQTTIVSFTVSSIVILM